MKKRMKYSVALYIFITICFMASPAAAQLADTPWSMFHHDLNHTGLSPHYGPDTPTVKWTLSTGDKIFGSAVIGDDGTVYIGTRGRQSTVTGSKLYAIYPNGTERWHWIPGHFIDSTPAIAHDGTLYVGCWDKSLYAIHPNGTEKWEFSDSNGGFVYTSPAIATDGTLYTGNNNGKIYAIHPNGTEKWNYSTGCAIQSSPAIDADGTIYVGSNDKKFYAFYPDGTLKWSYTTGDRVMSSPSIDTDGIIYVGSDDEKLYAFYPSGTLKWTYATADWVRSSPAIDADGTIHVGSGDKKLYAFYPNGTLKWGYTAGGRIRSSPAIDADGTIYVGSKDGYVYAVNPNGTLLWKCNTGMRIYAPSPAVAYDGTIYIGNEDGDFYAIGPGIGPGIPSNNPPVLDPVGDRIINETETLVIALNASDPDGDPLTYSCNRTDLFVDFNPATGTGNWITDYDDAGIYWVDFGVSDGNGGTANETIRIEVINVNRPPILDPVGDRIINETETLVIALNASDPDGDPLTYSCNRTDLFVDFNPATGTGNWITDYDDAGIYWVDFGVSDGNGGTANETIRIEVINVNRPPILDPVGDRTINETETLVIALNASDPDGDPLTYSCNRTDLFVDFNPATGTGNWITDYDDAGIYWVDFGVSDGNGGTANETIRIEVINVNRPPILDPVGDRTINETETLVIALNASDPDGDPLTYSCNRTDLFVDFNPATGTGNWITDYDDAGIYWVDFGVSDGNGGTANETIRIEVINVNVSPEIGIVSKSEVMFQEQFVVNITVDPRMNEIYGIEYDMSFDNSVLHAEWQNEGTFLNQDGADTTVYLNTIDNDAGKVSFAATRIDTPDGVSDPATLATIKFTAIKQGACTNMNITCVIASDPDAQPIPHVDINNSSVCVSSNMPPVAVGRSMYKYNNDGQKYICKVYFNGAESNDSDGVVIYWRWSFGDGEYGTGELKDHVYRSWHWNGSGYDPFTATLTVTDDGDPHELDNTTLFEVIVYTAGDANGDGEVDILDATIVGLEWDEEANFNGDLYWHDNPRGDMADLNNDRIVDILDAVIIGTCWGPTAW